MALEGFEVNGDDADDLDDEAAYEPLKNPRDQLALEQFEAAIKYLRRGMPGAAIRRGAIAVDMIAATHGLLVPLL